MPSLLSLRSHTSLLPRPGCERQRDVYADRFRDVNADRSRGFRGIHPMGSSRGRGSFRGGEHQSSGRGRDRGRGRYRGRQHRQHQMTDEQYEYVDENDDHYEDVDHYDGPLFSPMNYIKENHVACVDDVECCENVECVECGDEVECVEMRNVHDARAEQTYSEGTLGINTTDAMNSVRPYIVPLEIEGKAVDMELDTGASRTTIRESEYHEHFTHMSLKKSDVILRSYTGEVVPILGELSVCVCYDGRKHDLTVLVVKGNKPSLLGRDWLNVIRLNWVNVFQVSSQSLESMLKRYGNVFIPDNKGIVGLRAHVNLKPDASPVYQKPRPVPYSLGEKVDKEYERLIANNILYPVDNSDWGTPVVCVQKSQGGVRICGDYKRVNERIASDGYRLPNVQELLSKLTQGSQPRVFSCLDLSGAFNQLLLDEDSAKLLVLNTNRGLLATKRLTYGVKVAPAQFQAAMDKILAGVPNVCCYIDDILVATKDESKHLEILEKVLARLEKYNVKLNKTKCHFLKKEAQYLGHKLSAQGIKPLQNKVDAIMKAPSPRDVSELKSFLGMVNFYGKFVKNLSAELHPLYELLQGKSSWKWESKQQEAFEFAKHAVANAEVLAHYDPSKDVTLAVDASPYGVGAVISHTSSDGTDRPIAFASRSLNSAEKNYAQIEKEALAIIFGVKKFHMYLYGRKFTLETDHKPLTHIFGPKDIPTTAAARMQRWALILSGYEYNIKYRKGEDNAHADMLSRLPVDKPESADPDEQYIHKTNVDALPVTAKQISLATQRSPILSKVYNYCSSGWPTEEGNEEIEPFSRRRHELSIEDGCILWGSRVIIPEKYRNHILEELHECHPGMCRMKALARSNVWWPGLDEDIEDKVRHCMECAESAQLPKKQPLLLWPWTSEPMQRVHADFFEINKQMFHILVDSHSKWMEVYAMNTTTAKATIDTLRKMMTNFGLIDRLVTDNGPQYISEDFRNFLKMNGIEHTLSPPYHPSTNGQAEAYVKTFKRMFSKCNPTLSLQEKIDQVLRCYRNTPHTTTGKTPSELFLKRAPKTKLSLLRPSLRKNVEAKQALTKTTSDGQTARIRTYDLFQKVKVRHMRFGRERWIPGTIVQIKGPSSYVVRVPGNKHRFVHTDHLMQDDTEETDTGEDSDLQHPEQDVTNYPMTSTCGLPERTPQVKSTINNDRDSDRFNDVGPKVNDNVTTPSKPVDSPRVITPAHRPSRSPTAKGSVNTGVAITRSGRVSIKPSRLIDEY